MRPEMTVEGVLRSLRMRGSLPPGIDRIFVVDRKERLLGAIPLDRLATAQLDRSAGDLVDAPAGFMSGAFSTLVRRLPWLAFGFLGAVITGLAVLQFEQTVRSASEVAALAVVVASLAGVFAVQTAMVVVRGLALGRVGPHDWPRLVVRSVLIALLLSAVLGAALWLVAMMWLGSASIASVAAAALGLSFLAAGVIGLLLPMAMERLGVDPAFSPSGLTAVTDIVAYASVLALTAWVLAD